MSELLRECTPPTSTGLGYRWGSVPVRPESMALSTHRDVGKELSLQEPWQRNPVKLQILSLPATKERHICFHGTLRFSGDRGIGFFFQFCARSNEWKLLLVKNATSSDRHCSTCCDSHCPQAPHNRIPPQAQLTGAPIHHWRFAPLACGSVLCKNANTYTITCLTKITPFILQLSTSPCSKPGSG